MKKEEAQAMGKATVKKAKSVLKGQTGIFSTLAKEHGMVSSLMSQVSKGNIGKRQELFSQIKVELLSHAHAEEKEFYPVLLNYSETRAMARDALDEHQEVERMLTQLDRLDVSTDAWLESFEQLRQAVEHHAHEEEEELFPLADEVLDHEQLNQLQERFTREKEQQKNAIAAE